MNTQRRDALLKEYGEVSSAFRMLTDIRFKLLAALPIATAATGALKGDSTGIASFGFALFGLAITIGLATYDARNNQLYDARSAVLQQSSDAWTFQTEHSPIGLGPGKRFALWGWTGM